MTKLPSGDACLAECLTFSVHAYAPDAYADGVDFIAGKDYLFEFGVEAQQFGDLELARGELFQEFARGVIEI